MDLAGNDWSLCLRRLIGTQDRASTDRLGMPAGEFRRGHGGFLSRSREREAVRRSKLSLHGSDSFERGSIARVLRV